jgi:class 3 adenylate cyclase/tetratricopeptide (TPR) repeat protein
MTEPRATTVLITDMEGSTAFTEGRGDAVAMDLLRNHERLVREALSRHRGREIKSMGDGFMIAFDSPDDGVECALDIKSTLDDYNANHPDQPIRVRLGMNTGPVIAEGGDLYGTTVNATSRIVAKARSGQILVAAAVCESTRIDADWTFVDRGLFWLKGLRERWRLYEVARGTVPALVVRAEGVTPFIDRDEERAALRLYIDAALDGRGGLVLLAGEAGAGKTRLADEVGLEASGRGMRLLVGRCFEASRAHPFGPFVDVLEAVERAVAPDAFRRILGEAAPEIARLMPHLRRRYADIPDPSDLPYPDQSRRFLFSSVRDVLGGLGRERPLYLILDDLHWADEQSLLLLEYLAEDVMNIPVLIVGTYIHGELTPSRPLQATIEKLHRRRLVERFEIGPLAPAHLSELLSALGGTQPPPALVELLYKETEGNVFFAEEVFRHLLDRGRLFDADGEWRTHIDRFDLEVPETIRLTIGRRLSDLGPVTNTVLTTAAVAGRAFGFELLQAVTELDEEDLIDALDEAERARVIASTSEGGHVQFRFTHELIRQTLVGDVSLTRRQLMHMRIAEKMQIVHASALQDNAEAISYHLEEAGRRADPAQTQRFLVMAGEQALASLAFEEAQRHLDRALSLVDRRDPQRAAILEKLGTAQRGLGQRDEAIATWSEAIEACEETSDPDAVARMCLDIGVQVVWWRRARDVNELVDRGLRALGERSTANRAGLIALAGTAASQAGNYDRASALLAEGLTIAREHSDERVLGFVLYSQTVHDFNYSQFRDALRFGIEASEHLRKTTDVWTLANALGYVSASATWLGRSADAGRYGTEAEKLALKVGNWSAWVFGQRGRTNEHFGRRPDPAGYEQDGRRAVELGIEQGFDWLRALGHTRIALGAFWAGRWDEALRNFRLAVELNVRGPTAAYAGRLALMHAYLGDRDEALRIVQELRPGFPVPNQRNPSTDRNNAHAALEALAILGERDGAAALYPVVADDIGRGIVARGLDYRLLDTLAGIASACAGQWDRAQEHFARAEELARTIPARIEEPEALRFHAEMLLAKDARGEAERARGLLTRAIDLYREFGMPAHADLARRLLPD